LLWRGLRSVLCNPVGGTPTFGPSGFVFINGNGGTVDVFGNFPVEVVNANG
jgi:hypothetical protein